MKKPRPDIPAFEAGFRPKSDWASVGAADAFANLPDRYSALSAQRKFHEETEKAVAAAERLARKPGDPPALRVKVQLSPAATTLPHGFSAWASIGMTAYLQFARCAQDLTLSNYIHKYLSDPSAFDPVTASPEAYRSLVGVLARIVQTKIHFCAAARHPELAAIETYRLFMAAIQPRTLASIEQVVSHALLYHDLLFPLDSQFAHSAALAVMKISRTLCAPFHAEMTSCDRGELRATGTRLLKSLSISLASFLPRRSVEDPDAGQTGFMSGANRPSGLIASLAVEKQSAGKTGKGKTGREGDEEGLPIQLEESGKIDLPAGKTSEEQEQEQNLDALLQSAVKQSKIEPLRSEIIESRMRSRAFADGPLEGAMFTGHEVRVKIGENRAFGELFSRVIRQKTDPRKIAELSPMVQTAVAALRRLCYPSLSDNAAIDKFKSNGRLDGQRLPLGAFSEAVFKRYKSVQTPEPSGEPVLLLCCDGSASLGEHQMTMLKILAGSWILASGYAGVKLLAALYHSDKIRPGLFAPVVKWIYHPDKTYALTRSEAVSHVLSMPKKGTGKQADALSLAYLIDQAKNAARGKNIYLVLISDCAWNKSFPGDQTGKQEVLIVLEQAARDLGDRLHTTLIGLGTEWETGFESIVDETLLFSAEMLALPDQVVSVLARHTARIVRQREKNLETA